MFNFIKKLSKSKKTDSKNFRIEMANKLNGRHIRYVTEKKDDVDEIIGREGGLNVRDGEFIVLSSGNIVFRAKVEELQAWELLSLEGAVLTAPDLEHGGEMRTIIVYYKYYR